jgi:hypothetical protein
MHVALYRLTFLQNLYLIQFQNYPTQLLLPFDSEWFDGFVLFAYVHLVIFGFVYVVTQLGSKFAHLTSFVGEEVHLVLFVLYLTFELCIFSLLTFDAGFDFFHRFKVVAYILLDLIVLHVDI